MAWFEGNGTVIGGRGELSMSWPVALLLGQAPDRATFADSTGWAAAVVAWRRLSGPIQPLFFLHPLGEHAMPQPNIPLVKRRDFLTGLLAGAAAAQIGLSRSQAQDAPREIFLEPQAEGTPPKGKVLLAVQAHSDDIPLTASGTVAKLVKEGYTGYLVRATNDDMGDAPGLGTPGTVGDHVLGNERDNAEVARVLGLKKVFDLNYPNHRMGDVSLNELICRLIFLIRLLKVDTVVCWDPWAHDEENPDHWQIARGIEAACWMAGRAHDYPEQFAAPGVQPYAVQDKYYFARRPEITRV